MAGVSAVGFYVPRYSISAAEYRKGVPQFEGGFEARAVAGFDEDEITMAVAAGERALHAGGPSAADMLVVMSSKGLKSARIAAEALAIDPENARDVLGNPDAADAALETAIDDASRRGASTLVVCSDAPRSDSTAAEERAHGAAAVALLVARDGTQPWSRGHREPSRLSRIGDVGATSVFVSFLESIDAAKVKGGTDLSEALDGRVPVSYEQYVAL